VKLVAPAAFKYYHQYNKTNRRPFNQRLGG
jgi:hypothetical protein